MKKLIPTTFLFAMLLIPPLTSAVDYVVNNGATIELTSGTIPAAPSNIVATGAPNLNYAVLDTDTIDFNGADFLWSANDRTYNYTIQAGELTGAVSIEAKNVSTTNNRAGVLTLIATTGDISSTNFYYKSSYRNVATLDWTSRGVTLQANAGRIDITNATYLIDCYTSWNNRSAGIATLQAQEILLDGTISSHGNNVNHPTSVGGIILNSTGVTYQETGNLRVYTGPSLSTSFIPEINISANGGARINEMVLGVTNNTKRTDVIVNNGAGSGFSTWFNTLTGTAINAGTADNFISATSNLYYTAGTNGSGAALAGDYNIAGGRTLVQFDPAAETTMHFFSHTNTITSAVNQSWSDDLRWYFEPTVDADVNYVPIGDTAPYLASIIEFNLHDDVIWGFEADGVTPASGTITAVVSGTGGLAIEENATLTLSNAANSYGDTTITNGTLTLGANDALGANTANLTVAAAGTLVMGNFDATVATLDVQNVLTSTGGSLTAGATTIGAAANVTTGGGDLTTTTLNVSGTLDGGAGATGTVTTTGGSVMGMLTGNTNLTMNGSFTSTGILSYSGTTTLTSGTFDVNGPIYAGQSVADFVVGADTTLDLADASMPLAGAGQRLQINAADYPATNVIAPTTPFDLSLATLELTGTYGYTAARIKQFYDANGLASLVMGSNTPLEITIDGTSAGSITASKLAVSTSMTLDPNQLTIRLSNFGTSPTNFTILEVQSLADIETPGGQGWSTLGDLSVYNWTPAGDIPGDLLIRYEMISGMLMCYLEGPPPPREFPDLPESDALEQIYNGTPEAGSPTEAFQAELKAAEAAGATDAQLDQMTQQFTPALAAAANNVTARVNSMVLTTVGSQMTVPWRINGGGNQVLRAQNRGSSDFGYAITTPNCASESASRNSLWCQSLAYSGNQAMKDGYVGYNSSGWGVALGSHRSGRSKAWLIGLSYAYTGNNLTSHQPYGASAVPNVAQIDTHTGLFYGITQVGSRAFLAGKVGGTWGDITGTRIPDAANPEVATYATTSFTAFGQLTAGWNCLNYQDFSLTPKVKLTAFSYGQAGYTENWNSSQPMTVSDFTNAYCAFDFLFDYNYQLLENVALTGSVGYQQLVGAKGALLNCRADGLGYFVNGIVPAKNIFVCDLGGSWNISNRCALQIEYNLRLGNDANKLHGGTGTLTYAF